MTDSDNIRTHLEFNNLKSKLKSWAAEFTIAVTISTLGLSQVASSEPQQADKCADPTGEAVPDVKRISTPQTLDTGITPPLKTRPKVALVLGGGGTRGAAHVGVLKVLMRNGVPIDMIAGTSMGAIIGGLFSAGISVEALEKKFEDASLMKSYMDVPLTISLATAPVRVLPQTLAGKKYDGLYKGNKFREYLDQAVPDYNQNIENLRIPFAAVALNLVEGKPYALTRGNLVYALQASSAVPGLREPVQIGNQLFVDGGVVNNIPVDVARAMGADIVIAVDVDERLRTAPLDSFKAIGSVAKRILTLQLASSDAVQLQKADFVIHPNVDGIGLLSTKPKDAMQALQAGEKSTWDVIPSIKAKFKQLGM